MEGHASVPANLRLIKSECVTIISRSSSEAACLLAAPTWFCDLFATIEAIACLILASVAAISSVDGAKPLTKSSLMHHRGKRVLL